MKVIVPIIIVPAAAASSSRRSTLYEFLVESSRIDWSISVDETFAPQKQP